MNILKLSNFSQNTLIEKKPQQRYYLTNSETDSFQKTTNVAFKANPQRIALEILKNEKLSQKFMSLIAMGASALMATALGNQATGIGDEEISDNTNPFANIFGNITPAESEELQQIKEENQRYREEIDTLKAQLSELQNNPPAKASISSEEERQTENSETTLVEVVFPKKRGRLSKEQTSLKQIVEELHVTEDSATKLSEVCNILLNSKTENDEECNNKLKNLIENLTSSKDSPDKLKAYIDETYQAFINSTVEEDEHDFVSDSISKINIPTPKVVAKIDLEKIEPKRKTRISIGDPNKDFKNTEISAIDESNEIFKFKIPGTLDTNVKNNLTRLLLRYESHLSEITDKPKWMHARPISPRVNKLSIKKEIELRNQGDSPYHNITESDVDMLVNLINSEPRFNEYFTLHAALRLIDRLVNFNSEIPVEIQTADIIDKLLAAIQKGLSNGVEIENYVDQTYNANGARLIINSDPKTNPDAFDISGSYNLIMGICENQPDPKFYSTRNKTPLICTIFANGI